MNLILLLVSDIDDNFWFLTGHGLKKLSSLTSHHLLAGLRLPPRTGHTSGVRCWV